MQAFYLFSGLLICFALFLLIYPLIKAAADNGFQVQARKILGELKSVAGLKNQGVIDASAYEKSRRELADTLLKALEAPTKSNRAPMLIGAFFLSCLPLAVMGLYKVVGAPGGLSFAPPALASQNLSAPNSAATSASAAAPEPASSAPAAPSMDLKKAAEGLRARLDAAPDDGPGWELLGRTYFEIEDFANAAEALAKAIKILPKSAELYAQHGEAVMNAARSTSALPPPEAEASLDQALAIDAKNQNALWLKGVCRKLAGDAKAALATWTLLAEQLPPGSESANSVGQQIQALRVELGMAPPTAASAGAAAGPSPAAATSAETAAPAGISAASVKLEITLSPELKKQLAPNDVLFVFAKAASGPPMPLAAHRSPAMALNGDDAVAITLTDADAMMPTMKLSMFPQIKLGARISKSGVANASSGDFQALSAVLTQPVNGVIKLEISEILP